MSTTNISIQYRPVRIGFLVRKGSTEDLIKASGLNTLLWGGLHNPIIPVKNDGDTSHAERLIDLFSVDVLYAVSNAAEIQELKQKYPNLQDPGHYAESLYYQSHHMDNKKVMAYLDLKDVVDFFWEKEFKHKSTSYRSHFTLVEWQKEDPLNTLLSVLFGHFPEIPGVEFEYDYKDVFEKGLKAKIEDIETATPTSFKPLKEFSQIQATMAELRGYARGVRHNGNGIYIGNSSDFADLVEFWNLRAAGIVLTFFAIEAQDRTLKLAQDHLKELDQEPSENVSHDLGLTIYHRLEHEDAEQYKALFTTTRRQAWHQIQPDISWNGLNIQPRSYTFGPENAAVDIDNQYDRPVVTARLPEKKFLVNDEDIGSKYIGVHVNAHSELSHPGYTLNVPHIKELGEFYSREIGFDPRTIKTSKEGLVVIDKVYDHSLTLHPLAHQDLIEKIFEFRGIKTAISQAGLLAKKVIEKIGGIDGGRFLKIKGVRKLLQENKAADVVAKTAATQIIFENDFEKHRTLFIERRDTPHLTPESVFEYLLKNDFFRAGLELTCDQCKLSDWLPLKKLDDYWNCEFCGAVNRTSTHLKNRGDWKFRKSGLFAKDNNQEGAIPVILTLLTLYRVLDYSGFIYSPALKLDGVDINCETDLAVLRYKDLRSDSIQIAIGECKSEGGSITQQDCDNLEAVYNKIVLENKIECFLIFSKTADEFTPEEIALFRTLHGKGIPLILFANKEMEPYQPYWENEGGGIDSDVPEKYPHSLNELSLNSIVRYLSG